MVSLGMTRDMTLHRFFIDPNNIQNGQVLLPEEISHQITQVLRLKQSDQIIVLDNTDKEYLCTLTKINKKHSEARIAKTMDNENEPQIKVHLYQSLITRDNFELVLQKSVELGVSEITPIQTERSQYGISWADEKKERWQKIIKEAAEQSERGRLPILNQPLNYEAAIKEVSQIGEILIAWEKDHLTPSLRGVHPMPPRSGKYPWGTKQSQSTLEINHSKELTSELLRLLRSARNDGVSIFIGPEGGFTEDEIEFAAKQGARTISLGKRILRSETASIALLAKILI